MNTSCASDSLNIGDKSSDLRVEIVDKDRLCYLVKTESRGSYGVRTIAKQLLEEFIEFFRGNPNSTANEARDRLSGNSDLDRFEYGYAATLTKLAKMVLYPETECICGNASFEVQAKHTPIRSYPLQQIYYGAPGTGKSHSIKEQTKGEDVVRTTFHPDSDYATFVGAYKPTTAMLPICNEMGEPMKIGGTVLHKEQIVYEFVSQAFLQAYVEAWKKQSEATPRKEYLVIEEINRGNCAQIFGDLFQLLDRNEYGFSEYPIKADADMKKQLEKALHDVKVANRDDINAVFKDEKDIVSQVLSGDILLLPDNLYIWATMNTSDQSLFPIDSAFKRRWDWQYLPISDAGVRWRIDVDGMQYDWWAFLEAINKRIYEATYSEDKKLGYFFCKADNGVITKEKFVSKVVFYLWNDVFKDTEFEGDAFKDTDNTKLSFDKFYRVTNGKTEVVGEKVERFLQNLRLEPLQENEDEGTDEGNGKYQYNGTPMPLTNIVKEVVLNFANSHPELSSAEAIRDQFEADCAGFSTKVIKTQEEYNDLDGLKSQEKNWQELNLPNGVKLYINTQWRAKNPEHNFMKFIAVVHNNGWGEIKPVV